MIKKIHKVWVQGEDQIPEEFLERHEQWKEAFPDFEFIVWDDEMAKKQWDDYAKFTDTCFHHATRCDLILARAIRDFGGLAAGMDSKPVNVEKLLKYMECCESFVVYDNKNKHISNGLQWSTSIDNPFWERVCEHQVRKNGAELPKAAVNKSTGPWCYTHVFTERHWDLTVITGKNAYTTSWNNEWINPEALIDAGFARTWL